MKTAVITGVCGFVGLHLKNLLIDGGYRVIGLDRSASAVSGGDSCIFSVDLSNPDSTVLLHRIFREENPSSVFHLAGMAFVPDGWRDPLAMLRANTVATVNLLQAARDVGWRGRFLYVSSGEVYGNPLMDRMPLTELQPTCPRNPYSVSKLAAEHFALCLNRDGLEVLIARPFNHVGPGQNVNFVVPAFIRRIREAQKREEDWIRVGELQSGRDFTDVRDVVRAYERIASNGAPGEIYNVCTGKNTTIGEVLNLLMEILGVRLRYVVDPDLLRPEGAYHCYGSARKLADLGWRPRFSLRESIEASCTAP